jgi:hypothetical protein
MHCTSSHQKWQTGGGFLNLGGFAILNGESSNISGITLNYGLKFFKLGEFSKKVANSKIDEISLNRMHCTSSHQKWQTGGGT